MKFNKTILLFGASLSVMAFVTSHSFAQGAVVAPPAQTFDPLVPFSGDVISFGDSLSDNGNVFALTGGISPGPAFQGGNRFVNPGGLTFVEQLLGGTPNTDGTDATSPQAVFFAGGGVTGNVNLAVGGAFAGSGNLGGNGLPGVSEQIAAFAGAGGVIDATDTVTYLAGANNFFVGLQTVTSAAGAAALGQNVATLAVGDITTIATGGFIPGGGPGQVIAVNLPNLALLPGTNAGAQAAGAQAAAAVAGAGGDAAAQAAAAAAAGAGVLGAAGIATTNFNATLAAGVDTLAAVDTDTVFVQLDIASVFSEIVANPTAFGFTNVTDACLLVASCATADFATQNSFLFADSVHPTNAGYALIAELARQTLDPTIGGAAASGVADASIQSRQLVAGQALARARSFFFQDAPEGVASTADVDTFSENGSSKRSEGFIEAIFGTSTVGARGLTPEVNSNLYGFRVGGDIHQSETLVVGAQGSFTTGEGSQPTLEFEPSSFAIDLYGAKKFGNAYASVSVGAARLDVSNIERSVGVGGLLNTGDTDGTQFNVIGEVGYDLKLAGFTIIPSASVGFFRTDLDGYTESGIFAPLAFGDRDINSVTGAVNLRAAKSFAIEGGLRGRVFAGVGYEDFLAYDANDLSVSALASTAAASNVSIDDPDGRGFLFDVGAQLDVNETFSIAADYTLGIGGNDTESHQGSFRLVSRF